MTSKYLTRTSYREAPTGPTLPPFRNGTAALREVGWDLDFYYRPLEQVHSSGLHGWGVAEGLRASAAENSTSILVAPGVAVDVVGQHISLAAGGFAEIGVDPQLGPTLAEVLNAGVPIPTNGLPAGAKFLTIQWWETFDNELYQDSGNAIYRFLHTPWIRLVDAAAFPDNGQELVLARVVLDGASRVVDMTVEKRRGTSLPVQAIEFERASQTAAPNFSVENTSYGGIGPRPGGGIEVTVPNDADEVHFRKSGAGSFQRALIEAQSVVMQRNDGVQTVRIDTNLGNVSLGGNASDGDVQIFDHAGRNTVTLSGFEGLGAFGAPGKAGRLRVKNNGGNNSFEVDGANGDVFFRGALKDPNNAHNGLTHNEIAQLTRGFQTALHSHDVGTIGFHRESASRIGVTSAWIQVAGSLNGSGSVLIKFADRSTTPDGSGFEQVSFWGGYQGNFRFVPQIITSPISVMLSTRTDSFFQFWCSWLSWDEIRLNWTLDGSGKGPAIFHFLVIGPI